jgi:hypothetical protein
MAGMFYFGYLSSGNLYFIFVKLMSTLNLSDIRGKAVPVTGRGGP